jgi:N-acetylmuramoyl-L-alanine amidase
VLKSVDMPSVLVEAGFLTNSKDASIFKNTKGREAAADAIANGIFSYLRKYPPPPDETGRLFVHKVKRGDTLWGISKQYRTSVASIRKSNRLGNKDVIHVGQELVIRERYDGR